jgi:hypothetical protein
MLQRDLNRIQLEVSGDNRDGHGYAGEAPNRTLLKFRAAPPDGGKINDCLVQASGCEGAAAAERKVHNQKEGWARAHPRRAAGI